MKISLFTHIIKRILIKIINNEKNKKNRLLYNNVYCSTKFNWINYSNYRICFKKLIMKNTLQTNIESDNINKEIINMFNELEVEDLNEINKLKNV